MFFFPLVLPESGVLSLSNGLRCKCVVKKENLFLAQMDPGESNLRKETPLLFGKMI